MKNLALVLTLGLVAGLGVGCNTCDGGSVCGRDIFITPSGSPSPTPALPGATPDPCVIKAVSVGVFGGDQVPFIALGELLHLDATPKNDSGAVPDGCNTVREPTWTVLTPTTCQVLSSGYSPFLRGLRVGSCSVIATVSNVVSVPFTVEVK